MPTLSAANSLFELAFAVNAVLPTLISNFERVKDQAAESILRKLQECRPDFQLQEQDRPRFVEFAFRSSAGLRYAHVATRVVSIFSLLFCAASLGALLWSACQPNTQVSTNALFAFVAITLILAPALYVLRDWYLKWLYSGLVMHGSNDQARNNLFADYVQIYIQYQKKFEASDRNLSETLLKAQTLILQSKIMVMRMRVRRAWRKVRSNLSFKRTR